MKNRNGTYSIDNDLQELGQVLIDIVSDDTDRLRLSSIGCAFSITRHILLKHGFHVSAFLRVLLEDVLTSQQTTLLSGIEVELNGVRSLTGCDLLVRQENAEGFENGNNAGSIVI